MICTIPIHEFNHNHEPGGSPVGGQFAHGDGGSPIDDPEVAPIRAALLDRSFGPSGDGNEHFAAVVNGKVDYFTSGGQSSVDIPKDYTDQLKTTPPTLMAHTHPSSGAFSGQDAMTQITYGVPRQFVFGKDGSWYELQIDDLPKLDRVGRGLLAGTVLTAYSSRYEEAARTASAEVDAWLTQKSGWHVAPETPRTYRDGPEWRDEYGEWYDRTKMGEKFPEVAEMIKARFADQTPAIWQAVERVTHGTVKFTYHRATGPYAN